jgi:hypothetical protein
MTVLDGAYAKLDRAAIHLRDMQKRLPPVGEADPKAIVRELDGDPSKYVFRVKRLPVIDPELPLIVGDFLTNLRAALDHMAYALSVHDSGRPPVENIHFPIMRYKTTKSGKPKPLHVAGIKRKSILDALESIQPRSMANPAGHPLNVLNELVNTDKHRLLLVAVCAVNLGTAGWSTKHDRPDPIFSISLSALKENDPIAWFDFGGFDAEPDFDPHLSLQIRLEDPVVRRDVGLLDMMEALLWHVRYKVFSDLRPHLGLPANEI